MNETNTAPPQTPADCNKICFIICYNDDLFLSECSAYIQALRVPHGFSTDILSVEGAPSMTAGYQYAMLHSNAKYKVYLHQDVFIVNPDFLIRMLEIFQADSKIGMLGPVGTTHLPESGIMWENDCRCGACRAGHIIEESATYFPQPVHAPWQEVEALDGLLLATQYDINWREDIFRGWDFYDISQSAEFRLAGYKVVVPHQDTPWVIHDEAITTTTSYGYWRDIYLKEYSKRRHIS